MSPEQARPETVDTRGDLWAFGAVLFEMLSVLAPFRAMASLRRLRRW
jgi:serine/threonine protein kinase